MYTAKEWRFSERDYLTKLDLDENNISGQDLLKMYGARFMKLKKLSLNF